MNELLRQGTRVRTSLPYGDKTGKDQMMQGRICHIVGKVDECFCDEYELYVLRVPIDYTHPELNGYSTVVVPRFMFTVLDESKIVIDLSEYCEISLDTSVDDITLLSGVEIGKQVRHMANLDKYDLLDNIIELKFPNKSYLTITTSFWRGFLEPSVLKLGSKKFIEKYKCDEKRFISELSMMSAWNETIEPYKIIELEPSWLSKLYSRFIKEK